MTWDLGTVILVVGFLATLVSAVAARVLRDFSRHRLVEICRRRKRDDLLDEIRHWHSRVTLTVEGLQVAASALFIGVGAAKYWTAYLRHDDGRIDLAGICGAAVVGLLLLLVVEIWVPFAVASLAGESFVFHTWRIWRIASRLLAPLALGAWLVNFLVHRLLGRTPEVRADEAFEQEFRSIVSEGHAEGHIEPDTREMIEGVIELGDVTVKDIMTPRTDMVTLQVGLSFAEAVKQAIHLPHTRIPVYDRSRDNIVGVLYVRDLLPALTRAPDAAPPQLASLLRPAFFVPETKAVDDLLSEFQRNRTHIAVVLDEYGGVSGLVTIEDALEEIVGDIVDEFDTHEKEDILSIDSRSAEALARARLDEINERMQLQLPDRGEFDTIGGFVFHQLGRLPAVGEEIVWENVKITVLEVSRRRIERVKIEVQQPRDAGEEEGGRQKAQG